MLVEPISSRKRFNPNYFHFLTFNKKRYYYLNISVTFAIMEIFKNHYQSLFELLSLSHCCQSTSPFTTYYYLTKHCHGTSYKLLLYNCFIILGHLAVQIKVPFQIFFSFTKVEYIYFLIFHLKKPIIFCYQK